MTQAPAETTAALDRASRRYVLSRGGGPSVVVRVWGEGAPLVLLHGGTGSWLHWTRNIEALAREHELIVPDIPGFGESDLPPAPITPDSIAHLVGDHLASLLGGRRFAMAAFSMGGVIASHLAPLFADQLTRLVLVGPPGLEAPSSNLREPLRSWRFLPSAEERLAAHRHNLAVLMIHDPERIDALALHIQARNAQQAKARSVDISRAGRLAERLTQTKAYVSSIWGEHDVIAAPYLDERRALIESLHPDATFDVIAGAGHWVQFEAAAQFNRVLTRLLGRDGASARHVAEA